MKFTELSIKDVILIEPKVYEDERGFFQESFRKDLFDAAVGYPVDFVQDNHSRSVENVLRGLHYQEQHPQGKLVRVTKGKVFDVAVDIRKDSPTRGQWVGEFLSAENHKQLWVPPGFAHGFLVLSSEADFLYKTTDYRYAMHERCIRWNDPVLDIDWPLYTDPIVSLKDQEGSCFI